MTVWTAIVQWESDDTFAENADMLDRQGYDIISLKREE